MTGPPSYEDKLCVVWQSLLMSGVMLFTYMGQIHSDFVHLVNSIYCSDVTSCGIENPCVHCGLTSAIHCPKTSLDLCYSKVVNCHASWQPFNCRCSCVYLSSIFLGYQSLNLHGFFEIPLIVVWMQVLSAMGAFLTSTGNIEFCGQ